jgi:hypothetical protein
MFYPMDVPPLLRFRPVPVRPQRNGWTPDLQRRFILALARGAGADEAARSLGRSRQGVYRLRGRPGAASFAAAWDRAQDFARRVRAVGQGPAPGLVGIETLLVPRFYRGRLIGFTQRDDVAGLIRQLGRLDHMAAELTAPPTQEDFETLADFLGDRPAEVTELTEAPRRAPAFVASRPASRA